MQTQHTHQTNLMHRSSLKVPSQQFIIEHLRELGATVISDDFHKNRGAGFSPVNPLERADLTWASHLPEHIKPHLVVVPVKGNLLLSEYCSHLNLQAQSMRIGPVIKLEEETAKAYKTFRWDRWLFFFRDGYPESQSKSRHNQELLFCEDLEWIAPAEALIVAAMRRLETRGRESFFNNAKIRTSRENVIVQGTTGYRSWASIFRLPAGLENSPQTDVTAGAARRLPAEIIRRLKPPL